MKPGQIITNSDLQKVYDLAKANWMDRHNVEYEAHLWMPLCVIRAYCGLAGLPLPVEIYRDHYGPDEWPEIPDPIEDKEKKS